MGGCPVGQTLDRGTSDEVASVLPHGSNILSESPTFNQTTDLAPLMLLRCSKASLYPRPNGTVRTNS